MDFMSTSTTLFVVCLLWVCFLFITYYGGKRKWSIYEREYLAMLNKMRIYPSQEDLNLLKVLINKKFRGSLFWFFWGTLFIIGIPIIGLLVLLYTSLNTLLLKKKKCPFCYKEVSLSTVNCPKCSKYIMNSWTARPILEHLHK